MRKFVIFKVDPGLPVQWMKTQIQKSEFVRLLYIYETKHVDRNPETFAICLVEYGKKLRLKTSYAIYPPPKLAYKKGVGNIFCCRLWLQEREPVLT